MDFVSLVAFPKSEGTTQAVHTECLSPCELTFLYPREYSQSSRPQAPYCVVFTLEKEEFE